MKIVNIEDIQGTDPENAIEADGIHAIAATSYKQVYDAPLELLGCYRIATFAYEDPPVYLKTIDDPVSLRFGSTAVISPIPDSVIYPRVYFDFTKYENLIESTETRDVYTDFIGLVDHIVDARTKDNDAYIRLFLKTERNTITATLWKEIILLSADRFNRAELDSTSRPCTIALTTVKVTKHRGWFQLTSTPGTYTYINPSCAESATLLRGNQSASQSSMVCHPSSSQSIPKKNLSELLLLDRQQSARQLFRCDAKIVDFANELPWFKRNCLVLSCTEHVSPAIDKFFCVTHGISDSCRYLFMPTVTIADNTASATAMLFDDAVRSIIGQSCADLISYTPAENLKGLPEPLPQLHPKHQCQYPRSIVNPLQLVLRELCSQTQMEGTFTRVFSTSESRCLKIPAEFAEIQYNQLQSTETVSVVFTSHMFWTVKIKRINEDVYMTDGWSQVVKDVPLRENHFLEFHYKSKFIILLHVYTSDGSILTVPNAVKPESETDTSAKEPDPEPIKDPPSFNAVAIVRKHFRLPTKLTKLAGFYDGMKIKLAYEHHQLKTFKLRSQSKMVTYTRFTIRHWEKFAARYDITVGQKIRLIYDFQTDTLFMHKEN
ncbi:hypothetical protein SSX86_005459 [Deinandra increscens subsp. villosa]|uniref:TF-B3 domain-containing protein n=1 Tax=Deinandra increscens subsp. villosa TaxID=3103831 RepID=A0AAP0DU08_9ASTR